MQQTDMYCAPNPWSQARISHGFNLLNAKASEWTNSSRVWLPTTCFRKVDTYYYICASRADFATLMVWLSTPPTLWV